MHRRCQADQYTGLPPMARTPRSCRMPQESALCVKSALPPSTCSTRGHLPGPPLPRGHQSQCLFSGAVETKTRRPQRPPETQNRNRPLVRVGSTPDRQCRARRGPQCGAKLTFGPEQRQCSGLQTYTVRVLLVRFMLTVRAPVFIRASFLAASQTYSERRVLAGFC